MQTNNNNNQVLLNAIAELTAQVEKLTQENASLREEVKPGDDGSAEIDAVIKALPRERVMEVLGLKGDYWDLDTSLIDHVRENFGVEEIFSRDAITDYVKYNCDIDDVYDSDVIVEWVRDNRNVSDVFDHSDILECVEDFEVSDVLVHFGEEIVMEECSNQGWSKSKDVSDVISTLEDVISQLKA
jgi:hypothetical protein